jgi:hypothetical protein
MNHLLAVVIMGLLLIVPPAARAQPFDDSALEQIRFLHGLDPYSLEVWTKYLALQEQLIQKAMREQPAIVEEAEKNFQDLPATFQELRRRISSAAEKGLSGGLFTGSLPSDESAEILGILSGGELPRLEASIEGWIGGALAANEFQLRSSRLELHEAASILPPLIALARERERKQEIVGKIVIIIADVLEELARREQEQRKLDKNKGKADRLEPSAGYGPWRDLARSAE